MPAVKNFKDAKHVAESFLEKKGIKKFSVEGVVLQGTIWKLRLVGPESTSHIVEIDADTGEVVGYRERM